MKAKFRIKEYNGSFEIQKKTTKVEGFLFWKKKITKWLPIDGYGNQLFVRYSPRGFKFTNEHKILKPFSSLKSAKKYLRKIINGPQYHYPEP